MSEDMFRTVGRTEGERPTAVSCWPDAAPFTRFSFPSLASPSKKVTEFVALIEIPSKRKEKKKRVVPDQRESKNKKKGRVRVSRISKVSCKQGDSSLAAFRVETTHRGNSVKIVMMVSQKMITGLVKFEVCLV